jgi:KaiC/GvpD/RAD55 family RecA-like ATPase
MWELECMLAESGLDESEIFALVWPSRWNKWAGIGTGRARLQREIRKAIQKVSRDAALKERGDRGKKKQSPSKAKSRAVDRDLLESDAPKEDLAGQDGSDAVRDNEESGSLPFVGYSSFMAMAMEEPKWLIENLWTASSHGIIGGEPKTQKTTLAIALALSVASGLPFLGDARYPVGQSGPVLMVQEENAPWMMQDRMRKMAALMGLISKKQAHVRKSGHGALGKQSVELDFPHDLPLRLLNNYGYDLSIEEHREMLEAEVQELKPALVILDPLYLILGDADENNSSSLRPYLKWVMQLRYEYNCAVAIIHHFRKQSQGPNVVKQRAGQRLMGSATLHGWVDSAIYASAMDETRKGWTRTQIETEFRSMAPQQPIELALRMGNPGSLAMEVELARFDAVGMLRRMVIDEPGVTVNQLAEMTGMDKRTLLSRLRGEEGFVLKEGGKGRGKSHRVFLGSESDD